jgi:hypothetical protein
MATPTKPSILVLGAGELGMAVLQQLATHPSSHTHSIHVLLRPQSHHPNAVKAAQLSTLTSLNITTVPGDLATLAVFGRSGRCLLMLAKTTRGKGGASASFAVNLF